jgi:hypothetical protein
LVESTFGELEAVGSGYLDQDVACCALAACDVVARLQGHRGYTNSYTANVDRWVAEHPMTVSDVLVGRAEAAIDRILADDSELRQLWEEQDPAPWLVSVADLRTRVG